MPIYEYECRDCRRVVSLLVLRPSAGDAPACPRCGGAGLTRVMSRFVTIKSEEARMDALADDPGFGDLDEDDPASVARFMKKMGKEMGEDMGDDFDEAMEEAMTEGGGEDGADAEAPAGSGADAAGDEI